MKAMEETIRIGSRASRLAVIQSELVMAEIRRIQPAVKLELVTMKTTGDKILNKTLDKIGGKGLFLKELDAALLEKQVDICVHSLKDVRRKIRCCPSERIPNGKRRRMCWCFRKDKPGVIRRCLWDVPGQGVPCSFRNCFRMRS